MKAKHLNQHDFEAFQKNLTPFVRYLLGHGLKILASHKLSLAQYFILFDLSQGAVLPMHAFAGHYPLSKPSFTNNVDRLISRGLVKRMRGIEDRRTILVEITADGKKFVDSIQKARLKFLRNYFDRLPPAQRHVLVELLAALRPIHDKTI